MRSVGPGFVGFDWFRIGALHAQAFFHGYRFLAAVRNGARLLNRYAGGQFGT